MTQTEFFLEQTIGAFFWLVLLIPLGMFVWMNLKGAIKRFWPQNAAGGMLHPDQIITNKIFALGQNSGGRRLGGEASLHAAPGLRWASVAVLAFGCYWYYDKSQYYGFEFHTMDFVLMAGIAYYVAFVWMFSLRYDHASLHVRGWSFVVKTYDLDMLDSMTETPNGSWKLWFADGTKVEVLKFITRSEQFKRDMQDRVARNVANP